MSKYTPGPWTIEPLLEGKKYYGTIISLPSGGLIEVWTSGSGNWEASIREKKNGWEPDYGADHVESAEDYANAKLIAAAPEMASLLEQIIGFHEESHLTKIARDLLAHINGDK